MAQDINVCTFSGNLTRDPKRFGDGESVRAVFTLAVNNRPKSDGSENPAYLDMVAFNGLASKVVLPFCKKGTSVMVTAVATSYVKDEGNGNRTFVNFAVRDLKLAGGRDGGGQGGGQGSSPAGSSDVPF